jgi:hypothetical protein
MERVSGYFGATTTGVVEKLTSRVIGKDPLSIFHLREKHTKSNIRKRHVERTFPRKRSTRKVTSSKRCTTKAIALGDETKNVIRGNVTVILK